MIPVTDYLWNAAKYPPKPVCAVFGDDGFLKLHALHLLRDSVLAGDESEYSLVRFDGNAAKEKYNDVLKELLTRSMFGGGQRLVIVDDADVFVTKNRERLEEYVQKPSGAAVLVLMLNTFAANTRLYKEMDKTGLIIEAKTLPEKAMTQWIVQWSKHQYKMTCNKDAAELLMQRIGAEHGLLDQELAKLALFVKKGEHLTAEIVRDNVGAWRTLTVFQMLDFALEGNTAEAVRQLDKLLLSGEQPIRIMAAVSASLRKFAAATQLILNAEGQGKKLPLDTALQQAGVQSFFVSKSKEQVTKLGRFRGMKLLRRLMQLDLGLKGDSRSEPRLQLERFIVWLSNTQLRPTG